MVESPPPSTELVRDGGGGGGVLVCSAESENCRGSCDSFVWSGGGMGGGMCRWDGINRLLEARPLPPRSGGRNCR